MVREPTGKILPGRPADRELVQTADQAVIALRIASTGEKIGVTVGKMSLTAAKVQSQARGRRTWIRGFAIMAQVKDAAGWGRVVSIEAPVCTSEVREAVAGLAEGLVMSGVAGRVMREGRTAAGAAVPVAAVAAGVAEAGLSMLYCCPIWPLMRR